MDADYAWAAGFIDGEGGVYIHKARKGKYTYVRGVLKVNQAIYSAPILRLQQLLGGTVRERKTLTVTGKQVFEWQLTKSSELQASLPLILPYMIVKDAQIKLLLELATLFKHAGRGGSPFAQEREEIYQRYCAFKANLACTCT